MAIAGDVIEVDPGVYDEHVVITVDVEVVGVGGSGVTTIVNTGVEDEVVEISAVTVLRGFEIDGGNTKRGIWTDADVVLDDLYVVDGFAVDGAGLYSATLASQIKVLASTFESNLATSGGGAIEAGFATIEDSTFLANHALEGGAVRAWRELIVRRSTFLDNGASTTGGANAHDTGGFDVLTLEDSTFQGNYAADGGAIYTGQWSPVNLSIHNNTFVANDAVGHGGALYLDDGGQGDCSFYVLANLFVDNVSGTRGGAIYVSNSALPFATRASIHGNVFVANSAPEGSHGYSDGQSTAPKRNNVFAYGRGPGAA